MNPTSMIVGMLLGALVVGLVVFCYLFVRTVSILSKRIADLLAALEPVLDSDEIRKSIRDFTRIAEIGGEMIGEMKGLSATIKLFYQFAINRPAEMPGLATPASSAGESAVFAYDEGEAASRAEGQQRKAAEEQTSDEPPAPPVSQGVVL
jgi:hypothetical protein